MRTDLQPIDEFRELVTQETNLADYPFASSIAQRAVVYDSATLRRAIDDGQVAEIRAELGRVLLGGPGIVVLEGAFDDLAVVESASEAFFEMIADQHRRGAVVGDHYAKPGANDRVWNALEKLAVGWPEVFVDYYENDMIALISESWLGPGYQITSQINVVNPGGQAQEPHCDYHLGFMTNEVASQFPAHAHLVSPALTLQGAVAHCDMPLASGPTLYLPYSHQFPGAYLSWRLEEFREVFRENVAQLPLRSGDAVFFNPSMFHAAGSNVTTDIKRMANLLQISSAMGRSLESVDRTRMTKALYPSLQRRCAGGMSPESLARVVAASAEWYPFPTNLDRDPPVGGLTPPSQADFVRRALADSWDEEQLAAALDALTERRQTS